MVSARAKIGRSEIVVHRCHYLDPEQWVYSCYSLGVKDRMVGVPGIEIWLACRLAADELCADLRSILRDLKEFTS